MQQSNLPSRPRFSWDIKAVPWTDGKGDQLEYAKAVKKWCAFHDKHHDSNSNKISLINRGIVLQSHLYGRAKDLCDCLEDDEIASDKGAQLIVNTVYKKDPLSVVTCVYTELQKLLSIQRGGNELFKNFESRFEAQLSKFNALGSSVSLPESMSALVLLANSRVDSSQRISILAAAAPKESKLSSTASIDDYVRAVKYEAIASVLRQCDDSSSSVQSTHLSAFGGFQTPYRPRPRRMTRDQVLEMKGKTKCAKCGKYGHWHADHEDNGTLKANARSSDEPITNMTNNFETPAKNGYTPPPKQPVRFNMAKLSSSTNIIASTISINDQITKGNNNNISMIGPMLDDGAPYSAIGMDELRSIYLTIMPDWDGSLDCIPESIADRPFWQYGVGAHASASRKILGSVMIDVNIPDGYTIQLRHLVLDGSSNWVIGRNITKHSNIIHMHKNILQVPYGDGSTCLLYTSPSPRDQRGSRMPSSA